VVESSYDGSHYRTSLTVPGMSVSYSFDNAGRLDTMTNPFESAGAIIDYGYNGASQLTSAQVRPGVTEPATLGTSYDYDTAGRLIEVLNTAGATNLSTFFYTLNNLGNRTDADETLLQPGESNLASPDTQNADASANDTDVIIAAGITFTVNSTGDSGDNNTADGACNDGTGQCTLRAAIQQANATAGTDTIAFNIPGSGVRTIQLTQQEGPANHHRSVILDATTSRLYPSTPMIEIDGSLAGGRCERHPYLGGRSTVRGLVINRATAGIRPDGSVAATAAPSSRRTISAPIDGTLTAMLAGVRLTIHEQPDRRDDGC
jgi:CSLREA domain-containing protein